MNKPQPCIGGTDEEYETQHFGFGAQQLKKAMREMVERNITNGIKGMESCLQESLELNETDKATLSQSCDKLIGLYCERASPSLANIDEEIERTLKVPSNVLLPGDEGQLDQISDSEYEKLKAEVESLKKEVERGALMEALLTAEADELSSVENVCATAEKAMEAIDLLHSTYYNESDETAILIEEVQNFCETAKKDLAAIKLINTNSDSDVKIEKVENVCETAKEDIDSDVKPILIEKVENVCETAKEDKKPIDLISTDGDSDVKPILIEKVENVCETAKKDKEDMIM